MDLTIAGLLSTGETRRLSVASFSHPCSQGEVREDHPKRRGCDATIHDPATGIDERRIFPDLSGVAAYMRRYYS